MRRICYVLAIVAALSIGCGKREAAAPAKRSEQPAAKGGVAPQTEAAGTAVGSVMPAYSGTTLDGKPFDLRAERGQVVLLNLWATWCSPCRYEIPELQKIHDQYAARGFKVVGVSLDDTGVDGVRQFVTEHKMTYPIVLDPEGKLANLFQTSVIPTSVLIDRKGKIVWKELGAISGENAELKAALERAVAEKG